MMRGWIALAALPLIAATASAPVAPAMPSLDRQLVDARAEAKAAADRLATLEAEAAKAEGEVATLKAQQIAAAAGIEEAEARIVAAETEWRAAKAAEAAGAARLAEQRAPLAALLGGMATMGRRPPLFALVDEGGVEEMVRVKALIEATQPVIEQRSAALRTALDGLQRIAATAEKAKVDAAAARTVLDQRRTQFAELEAKALGRASVLTAQSLGAGDRVLASDDAVREAGQAAASRRSAMAMAGELARLPLTPARPMRGDAALPVNEFAYALPVDDPVDDGLGSVSDSGIVARGVRFATGRGAVVRAPADGTILFAAPYRGQDGIIILDHGRGRTTLLMNVGADVAKGDKVTLGQPVGRALGPVGVEYREKGELRSPAFIAASSGPLSNRPKTR